MAINNINLGTAPDSGDGDNLRAGAQKINDNDNELQTDIATNAADIATNAADIANRVLIQSKSFVSPSLTGITNTSSAVFMDTDLIVAITPKSASSKLRVNAIVPFNFDGSLQSGFKINIQKKVGAGVWTNILFGSQTENNVTRRAIAVGASNRRADVAIMTQIDSPGIADIVQFKVTFTTFTDLQAVTYTNARMRMITVDEIKE